ncbi:MAG: hypothetical protein ACQETE_12700 [Bacteroidota bacterium]
MNYPIFNSIVNTIEAELLKRDIKIERFKTWDENTINATGLEIEIDLTQSSDYVHSITFNFDWDRFREVSLARQLNGMEEHPFLADEKLKNVNVDPIIDIEVMWNFDEDETQSLVPSKIGNQRLDSASQWMEAVTHNINALLTTEDIITRWHIEVEGDEYGRYLSAIQLISYFQYSLMRTKSFNDVHRYVKRRFRHLLYKTNKVIELSDLTIQETAAA